MTGLVDYAKAQGVGLIPWQLQAAEAIDRGEYPVIARGMRSGKSYFFRLVEQWEKARFTLPPGLTEGLRS